MLNIIAVHINFWTYPALLD